MNAPAGPAEVFAVTPDLVRAARVEAARRGTTLLAIVEEMAEVPPEAFVAALGAAMRFPVVGNDVLHAMTPAFDRLPYTDSLQRELAPFRDASGALCMVFADPFNERLRAWAEERIRDPFTWLLAQRGDISAFLARHEESMRAMDSALSASGGAELAGKGDELSLRSISEDSSPVVRLVHSTLYDALKVGASDIHLENTAAALVIKYRIDGVLNSVGSINGVELAEQVVSRIKVMSDLDISERRVPQDGRFKVTVRGREIDFRVSVMPGSFGEDAVLRVLDKEAHSDKVSGLRLDHLGFAAEAMDRIRRLSNEPYGMVLVTGPTGSGKTTTLYAAISEINHGRDKIITIEDPVEYQLPGILQIPVNEKKGLSFARGLRSVLRHDPDKIMVGEIRDAETAQIAVQAALTGHLVFTTVHANNVFDVIGRFMHMGVDPYSFVAALNGIVAQRLVRVLCPHCTVEHVPDAKLLRDSALDVEAEREFRFRIGRGCGHCRGAGYKGRRAIAELLVLNDEIRELIVGREPIRRVKEAACRNGTRFLREAALDLVRDGVTSLEEINRVTFVA